MRRTFTFAVLAALLLAGGAGGLAALEWGGKLDNTTTPATESFQQKDKLSLWLEAAFNPRMSLTVQGSYAYSLDRPYLFDVDILRFQGRFPIGDISSLDLSLGRFRVTDFSALVFDDNLDGAQAAWRSARFNLSLAAGFLGLELQPVSTVSMSWGDSNDTSLWAPPRILEMLQVEFLELLGRQSLIVAAVAQQDLRREGLQPEGPAAEVIGLGGRLSTEYLGVALRGPLAASLYYDLFGYLGTGRTLSYIDGAYSYEWILSGLMGGGLRYFRGEWLSSRAELRLLLATGDADFADLFIEGNRDGLANVFSPISKPELALLFSPRLGNLAVAEASYSLKPAAFLQALLKAAMFLRPVLGPVSDARVDPASSSRYLGTEIDLAAHLRLFSDLGLAFTAGAFLPGEAFRASYREAEFGGRIELSFSF
jgi:hypothetical protein